MASEWDASELPKTGLASQSRHPVVPPKLRLLVLTGPDQGKQLELDRGTYLVGKAPGCELQLTEHGVLVKDLQSTNGSFFGGARFSEVTVGAGAVITIGSSELRIASTGDQHALPPSAADHFGALLGSSLRMREVFSILERVAPTEAVVLIEGETGTGKELCAEALHAASPRARGPF